MEESDAHQASTQRSKTRGLKSIVPHTALGLERIVFFSDAVIAIAITLLALEIRLPEANIPPDRLGDELRGLMPHYVSFTISFFVIGLFWLSHHRMFEYIEAYDRGMIWFNLAFLFLVALMPFPTSVLGRFPAELTSVVLYASAVIFLALVRIGYWWYVFYQAHLVRPDTDPRAGRFEFYRAAGTVVVFAVSILVAFWNPLWAMYSWIAILPVSLIASFRGEFYRQ